jgi:peptidoglycan-associated lipoprotein
MTKRRAVLILFSALLLILAAGCKKKTPPPPPPPAPAPAPPPANKPVINYFTAEPTTVSSGQPSSLRWSVNDATNVQIDNGVGQVSPNGRRAVYPTGTTTYRLTATGPGGTAEETATITVSAPPPPPPPPPAPTQTAAQMLASQVQDIHFEYDKSDINPDQQSTLQADAAALRTIFSMDPNFVVTIEGHCDERGSAEYNIGLGDRRAAATRDALVNMGVSADKLKTISYGKERPLCTDATEDCYARNRRAHFSAGQ